MEEAIGYKRISIKDQSRYSLEYQDTAITKFCEDNNLNLVGIFTDDGKSSYTFDRPDWLALEKYIKSNRSVRYLVVFDYDRFSRNLAEALMKIQQLESKYSIKVLATTESFDTDFTDPTAFMTRAFKLMMAENELWSIRKRTKAGIYQATSKGRYINRAPWGFINSNDSEGKKIIIPDENKAMVVRLIFREYVRGRTMEDIRHTASEIGFTLKGNSAIRNILINPVYAGLIKVSSFKGHPEHLVKGIHQPIISEADYWAAQHRLEGKTITRQISDEVPLRGVLRCDKCHQVMTAGKSKGKLKHYWYYVCHKCKVNLSANLLHDQLYDILDLLSLPQDKLKWFERKLTDEIVNSVSSQSSEIGRVSKSLRQVERQIATLEKKYLMTPDISIGSYKNAIAELNEQQQIYQRELLALDTNQDVYYERLKFILPKLHDLRQAFENLTLASKQQFVNMVFNYSLSHNGERYRTPNVNEFFEHNALAIKENGLVEITESVFILGDTPVRSEIGS